MSDGSQPAIWIWLPAGKYNNPITHFVSWGYLFTEYCIDTEETKTISKMIHNIVYLVLAMTATATATECK